MTNLLHLQRHIKLKKPQKGAQNFVYNVRCLDNFKSDTQTIIQIKLIFAI